MTERLNLTADIFTNSLLINGTMLEIEGQITGSPLVTVGWEATLEGSGTISGLVNITDGGTLSLGLPENGGPITMSSLTLSAGCFINDDQSASFVNLAEVTGTLTIDGGTINLTAGGSYTAPYQSLFNYGSFGSGGSVSYLGISNPTGGDTLLNNTVASSVELFDATPLYWAPGGTLGGNGASEPWNGVNNWWPSPTGVAATTWPAAGQYIAVFEIRAASRSPPATRPALPRWFSWATLRSRGRAPPFSAPPNRSSWPPGSRQPSAPRLIVPTFTQISAGGTLIFTGDDSQLANITVNCTSAGTLQFGDGSLTNTLPTAAGSIVFNDSSLAPASLVFDTATQSCAAGMLLRHQRQRDGDTGGHGLDDAQSGGWKFLPRWNGCYGRDTQHCQCRRSPQ